MYRNRMVLAPRAGVVSSVPSLLTICIDRVAFLLGTEHASELDVHEIPEPEIALRVWMAYERQNQIGFSQYVLTRKDEELLSRFAVFWNMQRLELDLLTHVGGQAFRPNLQRISRFAPDVRHLEAANPTSLHALAGLSKLTCLSLRGSTSLQPADLSILRYLPYLSALDLLGLSQMNDSLGPILACLGALSALNVSGTSVGDAFIASLSYRLKLDAWAGNTGKQLSLDQRAWPALTSLRRLQMSDTGITSACLPDLLHMSSLHLLDLRKTAVRRKDLIGLEKHLGLVALHGGAVLAASNAAALPWMEEGIPRVACCCHTLKGAPDAVKAWGQEAAGKLLYEWGQLQHVPATLPKAAVGIYRLSGDQTRVLY